MRVLAIESSCDETAAAVVGPGPSLLGNVVATQDSAHAPFGGVVPEVASREHLVRVVPVVEEAVAQAGGWPGIEGIAVTQGPGLVGALLVGLQVAKGLALGRRLPWVGVNHLEGHLHAASLAEAQIPWPHLALLCSGGHTMLVAAHGLGRYRLVSTTRDDAAGEAFDKIAKLLGLGYPGGARLERAAQGGDPAAWALPRARLGPTSLEFSFSGLKTAVAEHLRRHPVLPGSQAHADLAASAQEAICEVLVARTAAASCRLDLPGVVLGGGVAANGRLREAMARALGAEGRWLFVPPRALCTDNAAMIGVVGRARLLAGERGRWQDGPRPRWPLADLAAPIS